MNALVFWYPTWAVYRCGICDQWADITPFPEMHHAPWCRRVTWVFVWDARIVA